jgi:uncharacterized protein
VLIRSHYLPFYSRLGPYDRGLLDDLCYRQHAIFEYLGHAASLLPAGLHPVLRWRMAGYAEHKNWAAFRARVEGERPGYLAAIEQEIAERGLLAYTELAAPDRPARHRGPAWLRAPLRPGRTRHRTPGAGRPADAQRALVRIAMRALGVAMAREVADYFRMPAAITRARLRELLDAGEIEQVSVDGWPGEAYLYPSAAEPVRVQTRALPSPFDSLLWERDRTRRLFGFEHVFELYVKPEKRRYDYYVLPFLLGDRLVARADLKADRAAAALLVQGAWLEPGADRAPVASGFSVASVREALAAELHTLASWLGLDSIVVRDRGDLAASLT